jgi:hypothetical protein
MTRGIHRITNGWINQDSAVIEYEGGDRAEIPRSEYEAKGYQPPFDDLPGMLEQSVNRDRHVD